MKKQIKFLLIAFFTMLVSIMGVNADVVDVDSKDALTNALKELDKGNVDIKLTNTVELTEILTISTDNKVTIDLNGNNIKSSQNITLVVAKGNVEITGKGEILNTKEMNYNGVKYGTAYGTVYVKGAKDSASDYTHVTIGKDVTINGTNPLVIDKFSNEDADCYGAVVDIYGTLLHSLQGASGNNIIMVNSAIKHKENAPIINIHDGAKLIKEETVASPIVGISLMGYANLNVDKAEISADTGLLIYSGVVKLNNPTINANGEAGNIQDNKPTVSSGSAIQIESNSGYAGDIELTIDGGKYTSKNNAAILEYLKAEKASETSVKSIMIKNGEFTAASDKNPIDASKEFTDKNTKFITGGTFKGGKNIDASYLTEGYELKEDGTVAVIPSSNPAPSIPSDSGVNKPEIEEVEEKKETVITENVTYIDNGEDIVIEGSIVTDATETTEAIKETYTKMVDTLKERGYTEIYNMYEFHVKDNKSLTKLLTITFDLGEKNNGRVAYILHQKHDGTYEEFENTVENGKVSITVKELSPFVVALKDKEEDNQNTVTDNNTVNNAQTSSMNIVTYGIITSISFIGIVALGIKIRKAKKTR